MPRRLLAAATAALVVAVGAQSADAKQRAKDRLDVYTAVVQAQQLELLNAEGYDVTAVRPAADRFEVQVILTKAQRAKLAQEGLATRLTRVKGGMTVKEFAAAQPAFGFNVWRSYTIRRGKWKLHRRRIPGPYFTIRQYQPFDEMPELFNLEEDLEESYDVSQRHPRIVEELLRRLEEFNAEVRVDHAARYPT